jgi:hypothetical protein
LKNHGDLKKPCYTAEELEDLGPELEDMIKSEISKNEDTLTCIAESVSKSESLESLTLGLQRFSLAYSTVLDRIVDNILKKLRLPPFPHFPRRNAIALSILERTESFFRPLIGKILQAAKTLGKKYGADSIGVTIGFPWTLQFMITLKTK